MLELDGLGRITSSSRDNDASSLLFLDFCVLKLKMSIKKKKTHTNIVILKILISKIDFYFTKWGFCLSIDLSEKVGSILKAF